MKYFLASKRITKERFWSLRRTGDYDVDHVFNSDGNVCGLRLWSKLPLVPLKDFAFNQQNFNQSAVQLSLFDL